MQRSRCAFWLFVLALAILRPAAAAASVCEPFMAPLTQSSLEALAGEVRELFPERHWPLLRAITVTVDADRYDAMELQRGENGYELVVSATYLETSCNLALWPLIFTPERDDERRAMSVKASASCANLDAEVTRACLLGFMGGVAHGWEQNHTDRQLIAVQTPLVREMVRSAFAFALAHEFAHVLLAQRGHPLARLARRDGELAADLQALSIYASGRVWPVADTLLFTGRREFDSLLGGAADQAKAHDQSYCRALRSAEIRARLAPAITAINVWRSGQDTSFVTSMVPVVMNDFAVSLPTAQIACDLSIPDEVNAMIADFNSLAEWAAKWPADGAGQRLAMHQLTRLQLKTEPAHSSRSGMAASHAIAPSQTAINRMLDGSIDPAFVAAWSAQRAIVETVIREVGPMPQRDRRKVIANMVLLRFLTQAGKVPVDEATRQLAAAFEQAYSDSTPDLVDQLNLGTLLILAGDCRRAIEQVQAAMQAYRRPMQEYAAITQLGGLKDNAEVQGLIADADTNMANMTMMRQPQIDRCEAASPLLSQQLAVNLGWQTRP